MCGFLDCFFFLINIRRSALETFHFMYESYQVGSSGPITGLNQPSGKVPIPKTNQLFVKASDLFHRFRIGDVNSPCSDRHLHLFVGGPGLPGERNRKLG